MKHLKKLTYLLLTITLLVSCEKETDALPENSEMNIQNELYNYPNYSAADSNKNNTILNSKSEIVIPREDPCQLINGSFETGDFTGWNIVTNGTPYPPSWQVSGSDSGIGFGMDSTSPQDGSMVVMFNYLGKIEFNGILK